METVKKYFKDLSKNQIVQFSKLKDIYIFWNSKINVISRRDIENIYLHHVLHSLSIAKIISFTKDTSIIDIGTGGGFPGIPLAILFPQTKFLLIDSIAKKIKVVDSVIHELDIQNVEVKQMNALNINIKFDFVVSRAVSSLPEFYLLAKNIIAPLQRNKLKNGILYLKGGDIDAEIELLNSEHKTNDIKVFNISDYFCESYFETKKVIHVPIFG